MSDAGKKALIQLAWLFAILAALIFACAGTFAYWRAWLFLALFCASSVAMTLYLIRKDPGLLERRSKGGPTAETTATQKIIMSLASIFYLGLLIVPALDHRFGWSNMPNVVTLLGDVIFLACFLAIMFVFKANTFAASTITVEREQTVVSTGPYAYIRHPMYTAGLVLMAVMPLALGSWWGLLVFTPLTPVIAWRLLDEEKFLKSHLTGYAAYCERVKWRLIPFIW